jgi:hypothetical protein
MRNLIKLVLIIPAIGQLYLAFRLFDKNDIAGGVIFIITAIAWSIVALNINRILENKS